MHFPTPRRESQVPKKEGKFKTATRVFLVEERGEVRVFKNLPPSTFHQSSLNSRGGRTSLAKIINMRAVIQTTIICLGEAVENGSPEERRSEFSQPHTSAAVLTTISRLEEAEVDGPLEERCCRLTPAKVNKYECRCSNQHQLPRRGRGG